MSAVSSSTPRHTNSASEPVDEKKKQVEDPALGHLVVVGHALCTGYAGMISLDERGWGKEPTSSDIQTRLTALTLDTLKQSADSTNRLADLRSRIALKSSVRVSKPLTMSSADNVARSVEKKNWRSHFSGAPSEVKTTSTTIEAAKEAVFAKATTTDNHSRDLDALQLAAKVTAKAWAKRNVPTVAPKSSRREAYEFLDGNYEVAGAEARLIKRCIDPLLGSTAGMLSEDALQEKAFCLRGHSSFAPSTTGKPLSPFFYRYLIESTLAESSLHMQARLSSGRETVLFVLPRYDERKAPISQLVISYDLAFQLARGRRLVVERVSSSEELNAVVARNKNISHLYLFTHGNEDGLCLDRDARAATSASSLRWPVKNFTQKAQVILESCCTGKANAFGRSFARDLFDRLERRVSVVAPEDIISCAESETTVSARDGTVLEYHVMSHQRSLYFRGDKPRFLTEKGKDVTFELKAGSEDLGDFSSWNERFFDY